MADSTLPKIHGDATKPGFLHSQKFGMLPNRTTRYRKETFYAWDHGGVGAITAKYFTPTTDVTYSTDSARVQPLSSGDAYAWWWDLPQELDRTSPIKFQVFFACKTGGPDPDFTVTYKAMTPRFDNATTGGDTVTDGQVAMGTTIPQLTSSAGGTDVLMATYIGEIAGNTLTSDDEVLSLKLTCTNYAKTADALKLMFMRAYWEPDAT